jgi:hypothetical protein
LTRRLRECEQSNGNTDDESERHDDKDHQPLAKAHGCVRGKLANKRLFARRLMIDNTSE